jgi:hypothetical protein
MERSDIDDGRIKSIIGLQIKIDVPDVQANRQ